ncbi:SIMPL domain-containing protein [Lunatimonas salinarum]|uniref:SIMPL domain-containing protein n=1 Tax=Lunatimonas salinarum TaxID=1774590 RepID=UPI001ADFD7AA|nr:SIMPL domain-containing protein [Lunatimonas salinarum]
MKTFLLTILLTAGTCLGYSQQILVEGKSEMKVLPDEAVLLLTLSETAMTTSEVTNALNKKAKEVSEALKKSGVKDYDFSAENYYVNVNRIYTKGTAKDSGYVASQLIRVVVGDTSEGLVKAMEAVQQAVDLSFQLQFRISEGKRKGYETQLLTWALEDAKRQAQVIAEAMGISEYQVHQVDYTSSTTFPPVMYRAEAMMMKASDDRVGPTLQADEQTISDAVRVTFRFEVP